jgi:flagellar basal-body rod protein FlgB
VPVLAVTFSYFVRKCRQNAQFSVKLPGGIVVAKHVEEFFCMIEALFNQPGYLAAKKSLDAIANNIANLETPGYKRLDLAPAFQTDLERACASGDSHQIAALKPTLAADPNAVASSLDGNTVHLENELMQLNQNGVTHAFETQLVSNMLSRMRLAITGKS